MEVQLSCHKCLELCEDPITCVPCGHHYCKKCTEGYANDKCKECKRDIDFLFKNEVLNELIVKTRYF